MAKLLAFLLPLSLDTFVAAAALGAARPDRRARARISLVLPAFEAGMPLAGLGIGRAVGGVVGDAAELVAGAGLLALGAYLVLARGDDERRGALAGAPGLALVAAGIAVSVDELAVGFGIGLLRLPLAPALALIALQALCAAQLGLALGSRIGAAARERAEQFAGAALAALGAWLLVERLVA